MLSHLQFMFSFFFFLPFPRSVGSNSALLLAIAYENDNSRRELNGYDHRQRRSCDTSARYHCCCVMFGALGCHRSQLPMPQPLHRLHHSIQLERFLFCFNTVDSQYVFVLRPLRMRNLVLLTCTSSFSSSAPRYRGRSCTLNVRYFRFLVSL